MNALDEIYISFAREDQELCDALVRHLTMLGREGIVRAWHVDMIPAGHDAQAASAARLASARFVVLLVSAYSLHSDDVYLREMARAVGRARRGEACVIPVIVRACDWKPAMFGNMNVLPAAPNNDPRPVASWADQEEAWASVVRSIRQIVTTPEKGKTHAPMTGMPGATPSAPGYGPPASTAAPMSAPMSAPQPTISSSPASLEAQALSIPGRPPSSRGKARPSTPSPRRAWGARRWAFTALAAAGLLAAGSIAAYMASLLEAPWSALPGEHLPAPAISGPTLVSLQWGPGYLPCPTAEPRIIVERCGNTFGLDWLKEQIVFLKERGVATMSDLPASFVLQPRDHEQTSKRNYYLNIEGPGDGKRLRNIMIQGGVLKITDMTGSGRRVHLALDQHRKWWVMRADDFGKSVYEPVP